MRVPQLHSSASFSSFVLMYWVWPQWLHFQTEWHRKAEILVSTISLTGALPSWIWQPKQWYARSWVLGCVASGDCRWVYFFPLLLWTPSSLIHCWAFPLQLNFLRVSYWVLRQVGLISTFAAHKLFSLINFNTMYPIRYLFLPVEINIDAWDICLKYLGIRMRDQCCSETQLWILIALLPLGNCTIFDSIVQASHLFTDEHGREWHHSAVQHEYIHISFPSVVR